MYKKKLIQFVAIYCLLIGVVSAAAPVKIAFIGDQGTNTNAQAVLQLVASEGTQLLLIQGDLGYDEDSAAIWEENLSNILGTNFPVLSVVGNHENFEWPSYKQFITDRINRAPELVCEGDLGVKAFCSFKGIDIVQVAPAIREVAGVLPRNDYDKYIEESLSNSQSKWRICSWHKNQNKMQVGNKPNQTGWKVYQACLRNGGIVATGHAHSYSRTYLMSSFEQQTIVHKKTHLEIDNGQSFAFVSGLGGRNIRAQFRDDEWWAAIQTLNQEATYGALFCELDEQYGYCYFKGVDGIVQDSFTLESRLLKPPPTPITINSIIASVIAIISSLLLD